MSTPSDTERVFARLMNEPFVVVHDHMGGTGFVFARRLSAEEQAAWKECTGARAMFRADLEEYLRAKRYPRSC